MICRILFFNQFYTKREVLLVLATKLRGVKTFFSARNLLKATCLDIQNKSKSISLTV